MKCTGLWTTWFQSFRIALTCSTTWSVSFLTCYTHPVFRKLLPKFMLLPSVINPCTFFLDHCCSWKLLALDKDQSELSVWGFWNQPSSYVWSNSDHKYETSFMGMVYKIAGRELISPLPKYILDLTLGCIKRRLRRTPKGYWKCVYANHYKAVSGRWWRWYAGRYAWRNAWRNAWWCAPKQRGWRTDYRGSRLNASHA